MKQKFLQLLIAVAAVSWVAYLQANEIQAEYIPGTQKRISAMSFSNKTYGSSFKIFYGAGPSRALLLPDSSWEVSADELALNQRDPIRIVCVKGSFEPIYIQDEGRASGQAPDGYVGPFYASMWISFPQVSEEEKIYVRYVVKKNSTGQFAVKIDEDGSCQMVAMNNMIILK